VQSGDAGYLLDSPFLAMPAGYGYLRYTAWPLRSYGLKLGEELALLATPMVLSAFDCGWGPTEVRPLGQEAIESPWFPRGISSGHPDLLRRAASSNVFCDCRVGSLLCVRDAGWSGTPRLLDFLFDVKTASPYNKPLQTDKSSRAWPTSAGHVLVSFRMRTRPALADGLRPSGYSDDFL
jgi:hypothetical protein